MNRRQKLKTVFYRHGWIRWGIGIYSVLSGRTGWLKTGHLLSYSDYQAIGPLQRPEALCLNGLVQSIRPRVIVEFGFFEGQSAFNFLQADAEAQVYSFDIAPDSMAIARQGLGHRKNFVYVNKSQADFSASDIDGQKADLVFFDAAHDLKLNQDTFVRLLSSLDPDATLVIHDTGIWTRELMGKVHFEIAAEHPADWALPGGFMHQADERRFVNWILTEFPGWQAVHLHSKRSLRHGMTLLQRTGFLAV